MLCIFSVFSFFTRTPTIDFHSSQLYWKTQQQENRTSVFTLRLWRLLLFSSYISDLVKWISYGYFPIYFKAPLSKYEVAQFCVHNHPLLHSLYIAVDSLSRIRLQYFSRVIVCECVWSTKTNRIIFFRHLCPFEFEEQSKPITKTNVSAIKGQNINSDTVLKNLCILNTIQILMYSLFRKITDCSYRF